MIQQFKNYLLLIVWISLSISAVGRQVDSLSRRFNSYHKKVFSEKIFLHTDRSTYLTGETVWFSIFQMDASSHLAIDWSKILYVEVVDINQNSLLQFKFELGKDAHSASFFLPATLVTGTYQLRAYTSWMKNFDKDYFFSQRIRIINPFIISNSKVNDATYDVQFFPEGGELIYDLENSVAFRAVDKDGLGIQFNGAILNQNNDTIVKFVPEEFGLGRFDFTPKQNENYHAVIVDVTQKSSTYSLPDIKRNGFTMRVQEWNNQIHVTIRSSKYDSNMMVYLLVHTRQNLKLVRQEVFNEGKVEFVVDKTIPGEGVSHFTVFNSQYVPICERLWFKKPANRVNVYAKLLRTEFQARQKVEVEFLCKEDDNFSDMALTSVVVYREDSLDFLVDNIVEYVWLTSDLPGSVENPAYYFQDNKPEVQQAIDNLMLTFGWRRFNWKDIIKENNKVTYLPELRGHVIYGKIANSLTGKPSNFVTGYLSVPEASADVYLSRSDSLGNIFFEVKNFRGSKNLILQTDSPNENEHHIEFNNPFYKGSVSSVPRGGVIDQKLKACIELRSLHMQVYNQFYKDNEVVTVNKYQPFYGKPDEGYALDDYTRFPTLEEVIREYVPGVRVSKSRGQFSLSNINRFSKLPFSGQPLVLIDGVPVFNMNVLMQVDPLKIKNLDVFTRRYYLQENSYDGLVSLISYNHDMANFSIPKQALISAYRGLEEVREFFTPVYETEKQFTSTIPDVRTVLYRQSTGIDNGRMKISFFTSDIVGKYRVVIQALTYRGQPVYYSTVFWVK